MKPNDEFGLKKFFKLSLIIVISVIIGFFIGVKGCEYANDDFCGPYQYND